MFYKKQSNKLQNEYIESLSIIGNLSNLFSDSKVPYLYYRIAEKIFCDVFTAHDLSRGDIALDASKANMGIGLKTFLRNNDKTLQKVAEFNKDRVLYENSSDEEIVTIISNLRNTRIKFAQNLSSVNKSIYHCVVRSNNKFHIHEEKMDLININNLTDIKRNKNSIWFNDSNHEYSFNLSKSTLLKRFITDSFLDEFEVKIYENPLKEIKNCFEKQSLLNENTNLILGTIYLPLYGKDKIVSEKSGLNQWNASGRVRHPDEIYIPIPAKIYKHSPNFFPSRDTPFSLKLPNGKILNVKVCQDNSKALMSNPNKELGKWLLRDVLKLKEEELLTYKYLLMLGVDSVRIDKIDNSTYNINFSAIGSYEKFIKLKDHL